jgi:coiled-coil domain-containing protein 77
MSGEEYWRRRAETLEGERDRLIERLDELSDLRKEVRQAQWSALDREEEVKDLQQSLHQAHSHLFAERERVLALQEENDRLRTNEAQQKRQTQRALELANLPPDSLPSPNSSNHRDDASDTLLLQISSLQSQLDEHKRFASDRIAQLLEEQRAREADEEKRRQRERQTLSNLQNKLRHTEDMLHSSVRESHEQKRRGDDAVKHAEETKAQVERERENLRSQQRKLQSDMESRLQKANEENDKYVQQFRNQLKSREAEANGLHASYNSAMDRIRELEAALSFAKDEKKQAEQRRKQDIEGLQNDIMHMRKQVNSVDLRVQAAQLNDRMSARGKIDELAESIQSYQAMEQSAGVGKKAALRKARQPQIMCAETTDLRQRLDQAEHKLHETLRQQPEPAA